MSGLFSKLTKISGALWLAISIAVHAVPLTYLYLDLAQIRTQGGGELREVELYSPTETAKSKNPQLKSSVRRAIASNLEINTSAKNAKPNTESTLSPTNENTGSSNNTSVGVFGESEVDQPARLVFSPKLAYPKQAFDDGIEADVGITLIINQMGAVTKAELTKPAGSGFDTAALQAALRLRFSPAERSGIQVPVKIQWICHFRID